MIEMFRRQWLARGGEKFMPFDKYIVPRLQPRLQHGRPPAWLTQRMATCRQCPHADRSIPQGCRLLAGASKCYRQRSTSCCPADPPRWGPVAI